MIQSEIEYCYSVYTPAQNVFDSAVVASQIQEEIDLSWELYYAEKEGQNVRQKVDEEAELAWYDNECIKTSTVANSDSYDDYATIKMRESYDHADRYRKTCRSQKRFRVSVITAFNNSKRFEHDGHGKLIHNRRIICNPKDPHLKLWEQVKLAEKMKLVPVGEFRRKKKNKNKNKNKKRT